MSFHVRMFLEKDNTVLLNLFDKEEILTTKKKYSIEKCLISYEVSSAGKSHYHMFIKSDIKVNALRNYIKKNLKLEGNKDLSVSLQRTENLEVYIVKDGELILTKGYTEEEIKELKEKSYKKTESNTTKKRAVIKTVTEKIVDTIPDSKYFNLEEREIGHYVLDYYFERVKTIPSDFQLRGIIYGVRGALLRRIWKKNNAQDDAKSYWLYKEKILDRIIM